MRASERGSPPPVLPLSPLSQLLQRRHEGGSLEAFVISVVRIVFQRAAQPVRQACIVVQGKVAQNGAGEVGKAVAEALRNDAFGGKACSRPVVQHLPELEQRFWGGNKKEERVRAEGATKMGKVLNIPVRRGRVFIIKVIAVAVEGGSQQFLKAGIIAPEFHEFELIPDAQTARGKGKIVHGGKAGNAHVVFHPPADGAVGKAHEQQGEVFGQFRQGAEHGVQIAAFFQNIEQVGDFSVGAAVYVAFIRKKYAAAKTSGRGELIGEVPAPHRGRRAQQGRNIKIFRRGRGQKIIDEGVMKDSVKRAVVAQFIGVLLVFASGFDKFRSRVKQLRSDGQQIAF